MGSRKNKKILQVKPMELYEEVYIDPEDIREGDVVVAHVVSVDYDLGRIIFQIYNQPAQMSFEDYGNQEENKKIKEIISRVGKKVLVRVKSKTNNKIILERKSVFEESKRLLIEKLGDVIDAAVLSVSQYGLFVDIGNGIISLLDFYNISRCRYHDVTKMFAYGQMLKAALISYDTATEFFGISRRKAYPLIDMQEGMYISVILVEVLSDETGIFVEYDPGNIGIMDIPENETIASFTLGERVTVRVNKMTEKGFRCKFTCR